jgi:hypothetical protein
MRRVLVLVAIPVLLSACGVSTPTPTAPSRTPPAATPTPAPAPTVSGIVTATNGGQPLPDITVTLSGLATRTDTAGAFVFQFTSPPTATTVELSGASILARTTALKSTLDAFHPDASFDLAFYRQFARNGFEQPTVLEPIRRWTRAPMLYLKTVDEAGRSIDAVTLNTVADAMADVAGTWSGDHFGLAGIERGTGTREGVSGWITVKWSNPATALSACGRAPVGADGGWIELNYLGLCSCHGSRIYSRLARHELGHAFGYWHTDSPNDVMYGQSPISCDGQPSAREQQHARAVYSRPVGNTDPDTDPTSTAFGVAPMRIVVD